MRPGRSPGVDTIYREFEGTIHGFASYRRVIPSAARTLLPYSTGAAMLKEITS